MSALKFSASNQAWKEIQQEQDIRNYFVNCGLTSKEDTHALQIRLRSLVRSGIPEKLEEVLDLYDRWMGKWSNSDRGHLWVPVKKPTQLPTTELDGVCWTHYGSHGQRL